MQSYYTYFTKVNCICLKQSGKVYPQGGLYHQEAKSTIFAHDLDEANEVVVYAKLPRVFQIPTPVGNYAPDWAIAMKKDGVKHIFFIAETKGSLSSMDLTAIEKTKISCAEKLFNSISTSNVKYHKVTSYQDLIDAMGAVG